MTLELDRDVVVASLGSALLVIALNAYLDELVDLEDRARGAARVTRRAVGA